MKIFLKTILILLGVIILETPCLASTFYFSESNINLSPNNVFSLDITVNPQEKKGYTMKASIEYPGDLLEIKSFDFADNWIKVSDSKFNLIDNEGGFLVKTAGYPMGIIEPTLFGTVNFVAKRKGVAIVEAKNDSFIFDEENKNILSFPLSASTTVKIGDYDLSISYIYNEVKLIKSGVVNNLLSSLDAKRDLEKEQSSAKYIEILVGEDVLPIKQQSAINNFIVYGSKSTLKLGMGERAGVLNSYKSAFSRLPETESQWSDVLKIANGRWPNEKNLIKEEEAEKGFKSIYLREPDRKNSNDDAAVTIMTYGLRLSNRNLDSEKAAIKIFRNIFGYYPKKAVSWDMVRAIAYSGATR